MIASSCLRPPVPVSPSIGGQWADYRLCTRFLRGRPRGHRTTASHDSAPLLLEANAERHRMLTRQLIRQHYPELPAGIGLLAPPELAVVAKK